MRVNINLFWILCAFFAFGDVLYIVWNLIDNGLWEPVGTVGIGLSAVLAGFIAFYLGLTNRGLGGVLAEDRVDATIDDGDAEQGHFAPWSWWPIVLGFGVGLVFLGLAVGIWVSLIGAPLALIAVVGWQFEFYRGNFAR